MKESLHYLLMSDHFLFQKSLAASVRDTGLTPGQPKILDYLINHDGAIQREIAVSCHIEPASLTAILNGMENKGYIERKTDSGNRRSYHVYLTPLGRKYADPAQSGVCTHRSQSTGGLFRFRFRTATGTTWPRI